MTKEHPFFTAGLSATLLGGISIMEIYNDPNQDFGIERKADNSPLTLADKASHEAIMAVLENTGIPVLSEEGAQQAFAERAGWKQYWLIDPLDGTKEFIKKNGEFTVNVALIEDGVPVAGFVYVPVTDVLYYGVNEGGSFKVDGALMAFAHSVAEGNEGVKTEDGGTLYSIDFPDAQLPLEDAQHDDYVIVASRSHLSPETQEFIDEAEKKYDNVRVVSSGSSIKICLVAEGTADAYPRYAPTMEWDTAAADAVARYASKMCYQAGTDKPLVYNKEDLHNPWFLVK